MAPALCALGLWLALGPDDGALALLLVAGGVLLGGALWLESGPGSAKEVALVATLAGAAAAGRILFAAVPGVQPVTVITVAAGVALGLRAGVAVGGIAALASNFVLGFAFSGLMDVWEWYSFYPHTWAALTFQLGRGVWFDAAHAAGNLVLALVAGPELRRLLERYGRRLRTEVVWA